MRWFIYFDKYYLLIMINNENLKVVRLLTVLFSYIFCIKQILNLINSNNKQN